MASTLVGRGAFDVELAPYEINLLLLLLLLTDSIRLDTRTQ